MIAAALALFLQVVTAPPATVVVRAGTHATTLPIVTNNQTRCIAAKKLTQALGGTWKSPSHGHYTMLLGDAHVDLTEGVPFARIDSAVIPLAAAPTLVDGTLYVPFQLAAEVIPRLVTGFIYDPAADEIRAFNTAARQRVTSVAVAPSTPTPAPEPIQPAESAATAPVEAPADTPSDAGAPPPADLSNLPAADDPASDDDPLKLRRHHTVIVDAGHGGVDNGMTGPIGDGPKIYEKYITLSIAKLVASDLRAGGVKVIMTRTTDTLIALEDRGRIANANHGDVFVSIHVNATGRPDHIGARERGYATYFLAEAKTEDASRVERMENQSLRFETHTKAPKSSSLQDIITDMAQNEHLRESDDLAQIIQNGFHAFDPAPDNGVQQANFAVLRGSFMPAVLVETGFGTNPSEARFLSDPAKQRRIAKSIAHSVMKYLARYDARIASQTTKSEKGSR